jgi:acyl-CoA thioesterase-1
MDKKKAVQAITLIGLLTFVLFGYNAARDNAPQSQAGPLEGSTWCLNKDSMAVFGGSSSTGYLTTGYNNPEGTYQATPNGWWTYVTGWADRVYGLADDEQPLTANNYAHNGASFASYMPTGQWDVTRNAITDLEVTQPDLLILSLGTNEYLAQIDPAVMEANMRWVVDEVKKASPRTAMLVIVQQNAYAGVSPVYSWEKYKVRIMQVVIDEVLAMADVRADIPSAYATDWATFYQPDRIHLKDAAQHIFGANVRQWLYFCGRGVS